MCKVTKRKWHGKFNATKLVLKIDMRKKNLITFFTPEEKIVNLRRSTRVFKLFFNKLQLGFQCSCTIGWKVSIFGVFLVRIQSECGKIQTRKTPNMDTFHIVKALWDIQKTRQSVWSSLTFPIILLEILSCKSLFGLMPLRLPSYIFK